MVLPRVLWWWLLAVELDPLTRKPLQLAGAKTCRHDHTERLTTKFAEEPNYVIEVGKSLIRSSSQVGNYKIADTACNQEIPAISPEFPGYRIMPPEGSRAWSGTVVVLGGPVTSA